MERSEERNVLLEYFPEGHHFHYNVDMRHQPDECYRSLGWCSDEEADVFCRIVHPFIVKKRYDDPGVPFVIMKEAWDNYCDMIERGVFEL